MQVRLRYEIILLLVTIAFFSLTFSGCANNGEIADTEAVPSLTDVPHVHMFGEWSTTAEPSCTEIGKRVRYCSCGETEYDDIAALGHHEEGAPCISPTCTENGTEGGTRCSVCGEILVAGTEIIATGHSYGEWNVLEVASFSKEGKRYRTCTVCGNVLYGVIDKQTYYGEHGTAGSLTDDTVIVSIFANDIVTSWNMENSADVEMIDTMHHNLCIAVDWLKESCLKYDEDVDLIFDWKLHPDLYYSFDFPDINLVRADGGGYNTQRYYIESYIDSEGLKQRYNAQNIIYMFFFNADETNTINSWSITNKENCYIEIINIFVRDNAWYGPYVKPPATLAHEILHCFGAYDLYYASDEIPQAYVDHCASKGSQDIMYTVNLGEEITVEFTELCAYYVGITDTCNEVEEWGLAESSHYD